MARFTGGAREAALFAEAPFWPQGTEPHARIRIRLEVLKDEQSDCEVGLLIAAFKDLWLGDLPLGGETGVGRGVFEGIRATLRFSSGKSWKIEAASGDPRRVLVMEGDPKLLNSYVKSLPQTASKWTQPKWEKEKTKNASRRSS